jgi:hypothetical protein
MTNRFDSLKIVKKLKSTISPKLRWLQFAGKSMDKSSPDYVRLISGVEELKSTAYEQELEAMVRAQVKAEFPKAVKSYESLVDAVMINIKKKQNEGTW